MLASLTIMLLLAAAPVNCPSTESLSAELERLGTAKAVAAVGTPEVSVSGSRMRVGLRGRDGSLSGVREIVAPASCGERAQVAATVLSAWVGAWPAGSFPEAAVSAPSATNLAPARRAESARAPEAAPLPASASPTAEQEKAATEKADAPSDAAAASKASPQASARPVLEESGPVVPPAPSAATPLSFELGGFAFGIHDGDAFGFGGGVQVGLHFPHWLGLEAVMAGSSQRERAMERGTAAYRLFSLGVGGNARRTWRVAFVDLGVMPEATLLTVSGRNLQSGRNATRWGLAAAARARFGLVYGGWRPFLFMGASHDFRAERLLLEDYPEHSLTLSRWNFICGLGLARVL